MFIQNKRNRNITYILHIVTFIEDNIYKIISLVFFEILIIKKAREALHILSRIKVEEVSQLSLFVLGQDSVYY